MVSDTAESDIAALWARGLKPTVRDIVRLNAIALRIERGVHSAEYFALPRVAFLGDLILSQPTIAHELWLDRVLQIVEIDAESMWACRLYAAATPAAELVEPTDRKAVKRAVEKALKSFSAFTLRAVHLALDYVYNGGQHTDDEYPAFDVPKDGLPFNEESSIAVGIMRDGVAAKLGVTLAELRGMTAGEILAISNAASGDGADEAAHKRRQLDYFRTLDEITERLEREAAAAKETAGNG